MHQHAGAVLRRGTFHIVHTTVLVAVLVLGFVTLVRSWTVPGAPPTRVAVVRRYTVCWFAGSLIVMVSSLVLGTGAYVRVMSRQLLPVQDAS